jgi:PAS domain S-box-containing protein
VRRRDAFLTHATLSLLGTTLDPDGTLRLVAQLAGESLAEIATVDLVEEATVRRVAAVVRGSSSTMFQPGPDLYALIASIPRGLAHFTEDRRGLLVPLWGRSGLLGAIGFARPAGAAYTDEEAFVAKSLATRASLAFENARLHDATRKLEAEWRALYERHQRILDTAPAQVLTIDESGAILSLNRSVRGVDPRVALSLNAFDTIVPYDRDRVKGIILDSIRSGRPAEYETQATIGAATRWFNVRVGPLDLGDGRGAVLVSTDIEERKNAQREIAHMRAQLIQGEKLSALGSLVSGVAHELRTPLTFLSNNAFLLKRRLDAVGLAEDARVDADRYLDEISNGVDRINQLVEDLRRYTKARHDRTVVEARLDEAVLDPVELFRATNRAIHAIEMDLRPTDPVRVNVGAVQQVVLNLLQNAADAMPPGGRIRVRTGVGDDGSFIEVRDEGAGIPRHVQERMFEPLFTTKADGTGLGLSIVKRILDEHRATISCDSTVGRGTTFRVVFPRAA